MPGRGSVDLVLLADAGAAAAGVAAVVGRAGTAACTGAGEGAVAGAATFMSVTR